MTSLLPQIDAHDFYLKLIGIGVAVGALIVYVLVSYFRSGRSFLVSGEAEEEDRIATKDTSIERLQRGTWNVNFLKATTYSSVCVSTVTLAAVFIFQQRLTSYDALFWSVVLIVAASATFSYFLSIQMWFMAHNAGGDRDIRLRYRRQATVSQNTGWMLLMLVVVLVLAAINTYAGWFAIAVGLFSTIYSFEYKARVSSWERWTEVTDLDLDHVRQLSNKVRWEMAKENEFQSGLSRDTIYVKNDGAELRPGDDSKPIKIFSWNIDRGHVPGIIADYIIEAKPDIVCLQEVDWKNRRTKRRDVLEEIARRTHMVGYYAVEFLEIDTPYRGKRLAGGGVCGNAILTKLKPETYYRVGLANEFDWKDWKSFTARRQKRVGERCAIAAEFAVGGKRLTVVSAHLENMRPCGVGGRDRQFSDLLKNVGGWSEAGDAIALCGDLNTLENWVTDPGGFRGRATSQGKPWYQSECGWWKNKVKEDHLHDPFSCREWTVRHRPLYRAKLDWILLGNCRAVRQGSGKCNASDHRPIWTEVSDLGLGNPGGSERRRVLGPARQGPDNQAASAVVTELSTAVQESGNKTS